MSKKPAQWAIKQHIEKYPKCEWLCTHTNLDNLGEELQTTQPKYISSELDLYRALQTLKDKDGNYVLSTISFSSQYGLQRLIEYIEALLHQERVKAAIEENEGWLPHGFDNLHPRFEKAVRERIAELEKELGE